jgi:hypothetical protein
MTNTRDKLNEAKYFLEEMKRVSLNPDCFRYEQYPIGITGQVIDGGIVNTILTGTGSTLTQGAAFTCTRIQPGAERKYFFEEFPEKDVMTICQEAVDTLNKLVEECEIKFRK